MPHEPKKRHSIARQGKRRASIKLAIKSGVTCSNCGATAVPHKICKQCGFYKGQQAMAKK